MIKEARIHASNLPRSLLVYCVVVFLIGIWAKQKVGNMEQYLVADRDLGIFATGLAYYSTAQSSGAFLGTVGWAYTYGWASSNYVSIPIALGAILTWGLLSKRVHKIVGDMKGMTISRSARIPLPKEKYSSGLSYHYHHRLYSHDGSECQRVRNPGSKRI